MNYTIWLIGSNGMLGHDVYNIANLYNLNLICSNSELDISNYDKISNFAKIYRPQLIINCSGYTSVDKAEEEPEKAYKVNSLGVKNLALLASEINSILIHFSTDYVFNGLGSKPWKENDIPDPLNIYGKSKLEGENLLIKNHNKYFIFRISWLYGAHRNNFVKTILKLLMSNKSEIKVVNDQIGSPTYTKVLANNIIMLIQYLINNRDSNVNNLYGIYHYSDDGFITWYEFANKIKELALLKGLIKNSTTQIIPITTNELARPAKRPLNSRFDKSKVIQKLNFKVFKWFENLNDLFENKDFISEILNANTNK